MNCKIIFIVVFFACCWNFSINLKAATNVQQAPQLILPKTYRQQDNIQNWLMSEKLDGVRAYWNGQALLSRSGKKFSAPAWFTRGFPNFELDGELWTKRGNFEHIVSIVNRKEAHQGWQEISYQIFEVPNAKGTFPQRLKKIQTYLQKNPSPVIQIIPQHVCHGEKHLTSFLAEVEQLGGEGVVIRNPQLPYHAGRSPNSLKVKSYQKGSCRVTGYTQGKGKYKGMVGAILCQTDKDKIISIGSGLSDIERAQPPSIGSMIHYKYNGLTIKGNPRFPVFLKPASAF